MSKKDLSTLSLQDLKVELDKTKQELFDLKISRLTKPNKNIRAVSQKRKQIARLLTIIRQFELKAQSQ